MDFDADKDVGEQQDVAPPRQSEKRIWHRPTMTRSPVKEVVLAAGGSNIDGMTGSVAS